MRVHSALLFLLLALALRVDAKPPAIPKVDRIRIAEAFRLADAIGNRVWPKWDRPPFAVLLVTNDHEFLIRHPKPSDDFKLVGEDDVLKAKVWFRKRQFDPRLLATFPAVGGVSTIVIGQAENTDAKTSTRWVVTLLHEHFHQLQYSQPDYYKGVAALDLAGSDKSGMWMLNYPFPYADAKVKDQFAKACAALLDALRARRQPDFRDKLKSYLAARSKLHSLLKPADLRYLGFQSWQEGIAHYTEYHVAAAAAADYKPSREFQNLKDYSSFGDDARASLKRIEKELTSLQLDKAKRVVFYAFGAAEGLVLDQAKPDWRTHYFEDKFSLDKQFQSLK